jgi:group I intron endonuclease
MGTEDAAGVMKSGVYRIDLGGGWFYVGSSVDLARREYDHRRLLRRGIHTNIIAQRAYDKYGYFSFTVLKRYPVDGILKGEQALLDAHFSDQKCANIARVAGSPTKGLKTSDETKAKIRAATIGRKKSPEHRAAMMGRKLSKETREKIRIAATGRKLSDEHRATLTGRKRSDQTRKNISDALMGRKLSAEHCAALSAAQTARWARLREAAAAAL